MKYMKNVNYHDKHSQLLIKLKTFKILKYLTETFINNLKAIKK